jgi:hypothetical protein
VLKVEIDDGGRLEGLQLAEEQPADDRKLERAVQCRADRRQGFGSQPIQELIAKGLHAVDKKLDKPLAFTGRRE